MAEHLIDRLHDSCFVFRGYNITNLGKTPQLVENRAYGPIMERYLKQASDIASEEVGQEINLIARVRAKQETNLNSFPDAVALVLASEVAQIAMLRECHGIEYQASRLAAGYSLGEVSANICGGVLAFSDALRVPVSLAIDSAELGKNTKMGVVFSRTGQIDIESIMRLCVEITLEGRGVIAISAHLSPNSLLLLGEHETIDRFSSIQKRRLAADIHVRKNRHCWPPLHTPIVRQRSITDRAATRLQNIGGKLATPNPPIASLVTGKIDYNDFNAREILNDWTDHPQQVWSAVCNTLSSGVRTVIHVGPEPNLFPATYKRLADNVVGQGRSGPATSIGQRLVKGMIDRPWLAALLPTEVALLRAPSLTHIILEDWLLENAPTQQSS